MNSLSALAERTESECMFAMVNGTSSELKARLGITTARIGGGVAISARNEPRWNKALGFGFGEPVTADVIDQVIAFFRAERVPRAVLQIAPPALPSDWDEIVAAHGLTTSGLRWVKLACEVDKFQPAATDLRVGPVPPEQVPEAISVMLRSMGMLEEALEQQFSECEGSNGFLVFSAWDGDEIVATAMVQLQNDAAEFCGAATRPDHRGRGAHSALQSLRATAAAEAGCRWIISETAVPAEGESSPSLNNMLRRGFQPLYQRQHWRYTS